MFCLEFGPGECCSLVVCVNVNIWIIKSMVTLKFCRIGIYYLAGPLDYKLPPQKMLYLAYQPSNHTLYITYNNLRLPYTKLHVNSLKFTNNMLRDWSSLLQATSNIQYTWNDFVACNKLLRVWWPFSFMQLWLLQKHTTHLEFFQRLDRTNYGFLDQDRDFFRHETERSVDFLRQNEIWISWITDTERAMDFLMEIEISLDMKQNELWVFLDFWDRTTQRYEFL